ncbi:hypothetical protein AgCh_002702 [Apium graveolens]
MDLDTLFADALAGDTDAIEKLATLADHRGKDYGETILHVACFYGNKELVNFILTQFADKNLLVKLDSNGNTPLHVAASHGRTEVVEILINAGRSNLPSAFEEYLRQAGFIGNTALHYAVYKGEVASVELLVNADQNDRHIQNQEGETPMYAAVARGYYDIVKLICKTCTAPSLDGPQGTTALHAALRQFDQAGNTHKDIVMILMDSAKRSSLLKNGLDDYFKALFDRTDHENQTLLSLAVLTNHLDAVKLILEEDPAYKPATEMKKSGLKSLIPIAVRKGYPDIVKILCEKCEDGKTDHTGLVLLFEAVKDKNEELFYGLLEYDKHLAARPAPQLNNISEYSGRWTVLHYAVFCKFDQIIEAILNAQRDAGYKLTDDNFGLSPIFLAVQEGSISTAVLLMNLLPATSSVYTGIRDQNMLHIAVEQSNKDMIQTILAHCPRNLIDKIVNGQDKDGNTPLHLLIAKGCFVPELIKHNSVDMMVKNKQGLTPSDMLYSQEEVKDDQAKIKYLLDQASATRQFWRTNIRGKWSNRENPGHTTKRLLKDLKFEDHITNIVEEELKLWKEKIKSYRERTTTQIIVTALITTVTFTVGFTMPGGYHESGEPEEGLVLLSKKKAFEVFMVSDSLALALSITSLFLYFISSLYDDPHQVSKFDVASTVLNIVSVIAMILTFIAAGAGNHLDRKYVYHNLQLNQH